MSEFLGAHRSTMIQHALRAALAIAGLALPLAAQCMPHWSPNFGLPGVNGATPQVDCFEVFDDGTGESLYVGGLFTMAGNANVTNIARWNGAAWTSVGAGLAGRVRALFVYNDGGGDALYAGGDFLGGIKRWNGVSWASLGTGANGPVYAIGSYNEGTGEALFVGGQFGVAGGVSALNVARFKNNAWSAVGSGLGAKVQAFAVFNDGTGSKLFAGGEFITSGAGIAQRVARWSGSAWTNVANGLNGPVRTLGVYNDGTGTKLYAGGDFSFAGGAPAMHVARYDGTAWAQVGSGLLNGNVLCFGAHDDGGGKRLYAGGTFSDAQAPFTFLARWDGATWSGVGKSPNAEVRALIDWATPLPSGVALFAGGTFSTAGGFSSKRIAKWDDDLSPAKTYCTAKVNSQGCTPTIIAVATPSTSAGNGFTISAASVLAKVPGLLFYGKNGAQEQPFQGGFLCVAPPNIRIAAQNSGPGTGCQGSFSTDFNAYMASGADPGLVPGAAVFCQWWSRDPGFPAPNNTNLTNALQFFLCQ